MTLIPSCASNKFMETILFFINEVKQVSVLFRNKGRELDEGNVVGICKLRGLFISIDMLISL